MPTSKTKELEAERLYLFAEHSRFNTDGKNIELALLIRLPVVSGRVRPAGVARVNRVHGIQTMNTIYPDMESLRWVGERRWLLTFSGGYSFAWLSWLRSI